MSDTYKGDSPAKKLARAAMWQEMAKSGMPEKGPIVFLASRDMGDYGCLKALGLAHRAVAVERDADAFDAARARFPEADVRHGDVVDVVRKLKVPPAAVCLDFCGPIGPETLSVSAGVLMRLKPGCMLAMGVLRGREKVAPGPISKHKEYGFLKAYGESRHGRRMLASGKTPPLVALTLGIPTSGPAAIADIMGNFHKKYPDAEVAPATSRLYTLVLAVTNVAGGEVVLNLLGGLNYQSETVHSRGVPMTFAVCRVAARNTRRGRGHHGGTRSAGSWEYDFSQKEASFRARGSADWTSVEPMDIRAKALSLSAEGLDAALMLNLPPGTVAAWKAHETRGTYKDEAAE
jgi:hypothetical protein